MTIFEEFWKTLIAALSELAVGALKNYKEQVVKDGTDFAQSLRADLEKWTAQLTVGKLSSEKFEWLVGSKKTEAELLGLKQAGLAKVSRDKFVDDLVGTIISTTFKFFPKV